MWEGVKTSLVIGSPTKVLCDRKRGRGRRHRRPGVEKLARRVPGTDEGDQERVGGGETEERGVPEERRRVQRGAGEAAAPVRD